MQNNVYGPQIRADIRLAEARFGKKNVLWDAGFHWIQIVGFKLPRGYNRDSTNCLIIIPPGYGFGTKSLEEFYVDKDLQILNDGSYVSLPHYYERNASTGKSYNNRGWNWLCIHPEWRNGDNLITFLKQVELFLKYPFESALT